MDLQHLRASDGTGEAVLAHIQSVRNPGSTVLDLDNVDNWNSKAVIITGTPAANGFISPVGMKVMYGHLNAGDFIIDGFAAGYADNGNTTAEVAIVKMTTSWADTLVSLLGNALQDNGFLKLTSLDHFYKPSELILDHVASGAVLAGLGYGANLNVSLSAGVVYINGLRNVINAVASRGYTASKDTYVDALYNANGTATIVYTEVANNAASPALAANSVRLGIVVSGATIVSVASINQGQFGKLLPIVSSVPYAMSDSLGNRICRRNPNETRRYFGQKTSIGTLITTSYVTYIKGSFKSIGRTLEIDFGALFRDGNSGANRIADAQLLIDGVAQSNLNAPTNGSAGGNVPNTIFAFEAAAGLHTVELQVRSNTGSATLFDQAYVKVVEE